MDTNKGKSKQPRQVPPVNIPKDWKSTGYSSQATPSITVSSKTSTSIIWNVTFPVNGVWGNRFMTYDWSASQWTVVQPDCYLNSGTFTTNNLKSGATYRGSIAWYDGTWHDMYVDVVTSSNQASLTVSNATET